MDKPQIKSNTGLNFGILCLIGQSGPNPMILLSDKLAIDETFYANQGQ